MNVRETIHLYSSTHYLYYIRNLCGCVNMRTIKELNDYCNKNNVSIGYDKNKNLNKFSREELE